MTLDQYVLIGTGIGTCVSAVATLLTVSQMSTQRQASYKPELALSQTRFHAIGALPKPSLPSLWKRGYEAKPDESDISTSGFRVPLLNIGLGAAKQVQVSWSFDIAAVVKQLNEMAQRSSIRASASYEPRTGAVSFNCDTLGSLGTSWKNQERWIDYVLPAAFEGAPLMLELPITYVQLVSALVRLGETEKNRADFQHIPPMNLSLEFLDIGERKHDARFVVHCNIDMVHGDGERYEGRLTFKKAA